LEQLCDKSVWHLAKMQVICFSKEANPQLKQALNIVGHFANLYFSVNPVSLIFGSFSEYSLLFC